MNRDKQFIIIFSVVLILLITWFVFFSGGDKEELVEPPAQEEKENNGDKTDNEKDEDENKENDEKIKKPEQKGIEKHFPDMISTYKEFDSALTANERRESYAFNRNENYLDYIRDPKNKEYYMELLNDFKFAYVDDMDASFEKIEPLFEKDLSDLTLSEKLMIDKYFAMFDRNVLDIFYFNHFILETDVEKNRGKLSLEQKRELYQYGDELYYQTKLDQPSKEVLLYTFVNDLYLKKEMYEPLSSKKRKELLEMNDEITIKELAELLFDNYYLFHDAAKGTINPDQFVIEYSLEATIDIEDYAELEKKYKELENKSVEIWSNDSAIMAAYIAYNVFVMEWDDVVTLHENISNIPANELTMIEYFQFIAAENYISHETPELLNEHLVQFEEQFGPIK